MVSTHNTPLSLILRPSRQSLKACLHTPTSVEQECPILQETISTISFDTLPRPFDINNPTHTAITLAQCSHTFHAMALIYHWARSGRVLCPVCRAGPRGQRLSIRRLPKEWRYSLAARVRRQRQRDRDEAEEDDRQAALHLVANQHMQPIILSISPMFIEIRIEVLSQIDINNLDIQLPLNWTMSSVPTRQPGSIVFQVPADELAGIPYKIGTLMRIAPQTNRLLQPLQPSRWFTAGTDMPSPHETFSLRCDENGFQHIHFTLSELMYDELMLDAFMAYDVLVAVPNMPY
jgi:hypothetical protein